MELLEMEFIGLTEVSNEIENASFEIRYLFYKKVWKLKFHNLPNRKTFQNEDLYVLIDDAIQYLEDNRVKRRKNAKGPIARERILKYKIL